MSLNQNAEVGVAGFGGILAGQYEPLAIPVTTKTSFNATAPAIARGQVITIQKFGADQGKIREAVTTDEGPFGMAFSAKEVNDTRIEYISMQTGFIGYLVSDGVIKPGQNVIVATTAGQVIAELTSATVTGDRDRIVGTFLSKAVEVSKSGSGSFVPSNAADGDIVRVAFAGTAGEF
jgi:hypothetical protein